MFIETTKYILKANATSMSFSKLILTSKKHRGYGQQSDLQDRME